jgi:fluoride ion exporter CrcB/FEX
LINLAGCFTTAAVMHAALTLSWSPTLLSAITMGFVGGLTTYSSFNRSRREVRRESNRDKLL